MTKFLKPTDIMEMLGISRPTALKMMWQMNPVMIGQGKDRQRIVVSEESLMMYMQDHALTRKPITTAAGGKCSKRLQRR